LARPTQKRRLIAEDRKAARYSKCRLLANMALTEKQTNTHVVPRKAVEIILKPVNTIIYDLQRLNK
jgi:hypothetical protein